MFIQGVNQDQGVVDIIVALIALLGVIYSAIITYVAATINANKDRQIAALTNKKDLEIADKTREKDLAVAQLTGEKNTEIAKLQEESKTLIAQMKVTQDLQIEYDKDLRNHRLKHYVKLWNYMRPLPKYPEPDPMTYGEVQKLAEEFRDWYFEGGGLFMSTETREKYFDVQDGLKIVLQKRQQRWTLETVDLEDQELGEQLRKHLERPDDWDPPKNLTALAQSQVDAREDNDTIFGEIVDHLRHLGSSLRTSMTEDLQTRKGSYLANATPQQDNDTILVPHAEDRR